MRRDSNPRQRTRIEHVRGEHIDKNDARVQVPVSLSVEDSRQGSVSVRVDEHFQARLDEGVEAHLTESEAEQFARTILDQLDA